MNHINPDHISFIYLDAGDVLIKRVSRYQDKIADILGFPPEEYDMIFTDTLDKVPQEQKEAFEKVTTLEQEYALINEFHEWMCAYLGISNYSRDLIHTLTKTRIQADFEVKEGVMEGLQRLSTSYRLGVLSNALPSRRHYELKLNNMDTYFEHIIISYEEGLHKPDPRLCKIALERVDISPEEVLFVDNKVSYLKGAKQAGIKNLVLMKVKEESDRYPMIDNLVELAQMLDC